MTSRQAAVAGSFYPENANQLRILLANFLNAKQVSPLSEAQTRSIKALIVPHAGYVYSGAIAASAYQLLKSRHQQITRVILLGPSHRVPLRGIALPSVDQFTTPLGNIPLDKDGIASLLTLNQVQVSDQAHDHEHSLEVQLPFLQSVLDDFLLLPLVVGACDASTVETALQKVWGGDETLIVISSDLSHYHSYQSACALDRHTSELITQKHYHLHGEQACGAYPLNGLLKLATELPLSVCPLDLRNSGDTAGDKDRVVGYGAFALYH